MRTRTARPFPIRRRRVLRARRKPQPEPVRSPVIASGKLAGRTVASLSTEELQDFIRGDARWQFVTPVKNLFPGFFNSCCMPVATQGPYWAAQYELLRRQRTESPVSVPRLNVVMSNDPKETLRSLLKAAFRLAARQMHPDLHGGSGEEMKRLNAARDLFDRLIS